MSRTRKKGADSSKPIRYEVKTSYITTAEAAASVAHLFTLAYLNEIVSKLNCPPLEDTISTQKIMLEERLVLFEKQRDRQGALFRASLGPNAIIVDPEAPVEDEKILRLEASLPKDWKRFREQLTHLENTHRTCIDDSARHEWFSEDDKNYLEALLSKLQTVSSILDELQPKLCEMPRSRGQHGAMGLLNIELAATIFSLLPSAWQEAGVNKPISAAKRYSIVQQCLALQL